MHSNVKSLRQANCLKCLIWTDFGQPFVLQATPSSTDLPTLWHSVACRSLCPAPLPYLWRRTATLRHSRSRTPLRSLWVNQSRVKLFGATLQLTWEPMTSRGAFMKHLTSHLSQCFYLLRAGLAECPPLQLVQLVQLVLVALPVAQKTRQPCVNWSTLW